MTPVDIISWTGVLLKHHQGSFLLKLMGTNTETHIYTMSQDRETLGNSVLNGMSLLNSSHQGPRNSSQEEVERFYESEGMADTMKPGLLNTAGLMQV